MLHVIVTMVIKEGRMAEFLALCETLRPQVLAEPGCLAYDYTREMDAGLGIQEPVDPNRITLIERWASPEALKKHLEALHMKEAGPRLKELRTSVTARVGESVF
jgi:quinol monooxygenase YgiN